MDTTTQVISILFVTFVLAVSLIVTQFVYIRQRRNPLVLREIPAYSGLPRLANAGVETNRPLHLGFGSAGIGGDNTMLALAAAELFYHVAERAVIGDVSPIITLTDPSALPLGQDTLRRAYQARGLSDRFSYGSVRWYPSGNRSLAYAGALTAMMGDDRVSANVLAGSFGVELALILHAAQRRNLPSVAVSNQLQGQAIAYVMSDAPLIGEEVFVSGAYLSEDVGQLSLAVTMDILRWLLIVGIIVGALFQMEWFRQIIQSILKIFGVGGG